MINKVKKILYSASILCALTTLSWAQDTEQKELESRLEEEQEYLEAVTINPQITIDEIITISGKHLAPTHCRCCGRHSIVITPRAGVDPNTVMIRGYRIKQDINTLEKRGAALLSQLYHPEKGIVIAPLLDFRNHNQYALKVQRITFDENNKPHLGNFINAHDIIDVRLATQEEKEEFGYLKPLYLGDLLITHEKLFIGCSVALVLALAALTAHDVKTAIQEDRDAEQARLSRRKKTLPSKNALKKKNYQRT